MPSSPNSLNWYRLGTALKLDCWALENQWTVIHYQSDWSVWCVELPLLELGSPAQSWSVLAQWGHMVQDVASISSEQVGGNVRITKQIWEAACWAFSSRRGNRIWYRLAPWILPPLGLNCPHFTLIGPVTSHPRSILTLPLHQLSGSLTCHRAQCLDLTLARQCRPSHLVPQAYFIPQRLLYSHKTR